MSVAILKYRINNWLCSIIATAPFYLSSCTPISVYDRVEKNYGNKVDKIANDFNLSPAYLKALIILESSGNRFIQPRFEKHVYNKLLLVKKGKIKNFEGLTHKHLRKASNQSLTDLASSWGPFQIMGYKSIHLRINIADLRGDSSIFWGAKWINKEYGNYLRKKKFEAAFRIHNTGNPYGNTYNTKYVSKGLDYIKHFQNRDI